MGYAELGDSKVDCRRVDVNIFFTVVAFSGVVEGMCLVPAYCYARKAVQYMYCILCLLHEEQRSFEGEVSDT